MIPTCEKSISPPFPNVYSVKEVEPSTMQTWCRRPACRPVQWWDSQTRPTLRQVAAKPALGFFVLTSRAAEQAHRYTFRVAYPAFAHRYTAAQVQEARRDRRNPLASASDRSDFCIP